MTPATKPPHVPEDHADEYAGLSSADRALVTPQALQRWTAGLAPDDYSLADVARNERQRVQNLQTLRQGAELTEQEWRLLRYLQRHEGKVRTYVQIAHALWGTPGHPITAASMRQLDIGYAVPMIRTIQVYVHQIRRKLEVDPIRPQHLATVRGVGYIFYWAPPSLDDGINYERRATEHELYRVAMLHELGLVESEAPIFRSVDEAGVGTSRLGPGPEHRDYHEGRVVEASSEPARTDWRGEPFPTVDEEAAP